MKNLKINKEKKKKLNPQRRGKMFEKLMRDSLIYFEIEGRVLEDFWDRPMKFSMSDKKLVGDFWCMTVDYKYYLFENKIVNSKTSIGFDRIYTHQRKNLKLATRKDTHRGWLLVWFKPNRENYGIYALRGDYLNHIYTDRSNTSISRVDLDLDILSEKYKDSLVKLKIIDSGDKFKNKVKIIDLNSLFII